MHILKVYKELNVTNGEFLEALKTLGYTESNTGNPKHYRYINETVNSVVDIPKKPLDAFILKAFTASYSWLLYQQGVIAAYDDLVKMIEKERLKKKRKAKKQIAVAA